MQRILMTLTESEETVKYEYDLREVPPNPPVTWVDQLTYISTGYLKLLLSGYYDIDEEYERLAADTLDAIEKGVIEQ